MRAITVSPGPIRTGVWTDPDGFIGRVAQEQGVSHEDFVQQMMGSLGASTGRISTPEEVARLIAFVASPNNVNGAEYLVDGGITKEPLTPANLTGGTEQVRDGLLRGGGHAFQEPQSRTSAGGVTRVRPWRAAA